MHPLTVSKGPCLLAFLFLLPTLLYCRQKAQWRHLSSKTGDLPVPWTSTEQTSAMIADIDKDGVNDFVLSCRKAAPALVWYRRTVKGWRRYVLEKNLKTIEAGGVCYDVDNDGDPDLIYGQDWQGPEIWWWENPYPHYDTAVAWIRHTIKTSGAHQHHDQAIADFIQTGKPQLAFWNQGNNTLNIAFLPDDPRNIPAWQTKVIFSGDAGSRQSWYPEGAAAADIDGDGYPDLLAGNLWFKYKGNGVFKSVHVARIGGRVAAGKLKPGKTMQIVTAPGDGIGPVCWYECTGNPEDSTAWVEHKLTDRDFVHGHTLAIADINSDGNLDIFAAEMAKWTESKATPDNPDAIAYIFYGDGKGIFTPVVFRKGMGFHESKPGDLDGDGDIDILNKPYNWQTPGIDVFLQRGTGKRLPSLTALYSRYGLEIYSLREEMKKDVPAALAMIKQMGINEVEIPGYYNLTPAQFKAALQKAGLQPTSILFDYSRYKTDLPGIIKEAKSFGITSVGFAWMPHDKFDKDAAVKAAAFMNETGARLRAAGLHFFYHPHGYEFVPSEEGTLFDYIVQHTRKENISFQLDVFWAARGGADAALLLNKYPGRFSSLHIKDLQWGAATSDYTGAAPDSTSVAAGEGQVSWPEVLRAAVKAGVQRYYIEDEAPDAAAQIPQSLKYLRSLK